MAKTVRGHSYYFPILRAYEARYSKANLTIYDNGHPLFRVVPLLISYLRIKFGLNTRTEEEGALFTAAHWTTRKRVTRRIDTFHRNQWWQMKAAAGQKHAKTRTCPLVTIAVNYKLQKVIMISPTF